MSACPVTGFAVNSVSILEARIHAAAKMDSFWIQMAELAQVNLNALSQDDVIWLSQLNFISPAAPYLHWKSSPNELNKSQCDVCLGHKLRCKNITRGMLLLLDRINTI